MSVYILGIESSCDETSAAVLKDNHLLSNIIANQAVHRNYGGVVPELASRAHQQNIVPVVHAALQQANIDKKQLSAIAYTRGPGLLGSLLVGSSFAKTFALGLQKPLIEADHMQAHVLAHFIEDAEDRPMPGFPFLCLTVSGGHTQIVKVSGHFQMEVIGATLDDAAGETFDKAAKIMGLPYPGGPLIDKMSAEGDSSRFSFAKPYVEGLNYSFSGLKTSILYFLRDQLKNDPDFIEKNKTDLAASIQKTIVDLLMEKVRQASIQTNIREIAIAGGVSANSGLRSKLREMASANHWKVYIPPFAYTTDNAAMIAISGYYKYLRKDFAGFSTRPYARSPQP